jgi:myo-inositol-1(or 4)-monophosphatase
MKKMIYNKNVENIITCAVNGNYTVEQKDDSSYVTTIDKKISNELQDYYRKMFPNAAIISEENDIRDYDAEHIFLIAPLDGTENFVSGVPIFGTSISYYRNLQHNYSMLYFPKLDAFISTKYYPTIYRQKSRIIALSSSLTLSEIQKQQQRSGEEFRIFGCCTYSLYGVIKGYFKSYFNPRVNTWDILAGINIALKTGCNVIIDGKEWNGEFLRADKKYSCYVQNNY